MLDHAPPAESNLLLLGSSPAASPQIAKSEHVEDRTLMQDLLRPVVIVGALGYFVDIYDLTLFMNVRE
jgi:hypothetical protein